MPKRSRWVCREALYSLVTPGHLLSPDLFLNYRHVIEYLLYVGRTTPNQRVHLSQLWNDTVCVRWGPLWRLRSAAKHLGLDLLRILLCFLFTTMHIRWMKIFTLLNILSEIHTDKVCLAKASQRRQDCQGQTALIDVSLTLHAGFLLFNQQSTTPIFTSSCTNRLS